MNEIWTCLNGPENVIRMETATFPSRPAVEPLSPYLLERFGDQAGEASINQMCGHMIRQVLEGGIRQWNARPWTGRTGSARTSLCSCIA